MSDLLYSQRLADAEDFTIVADNAPCWPIKVVLSLELVRDIQNGDSDGHFVFEVHEAKQFRKALGGAIKAVKAVRNG